MVSIKCEHISMFLQSQKFVFQFNDDISKDEIYII